jgi:tetraprenyl-beta-curcumene synthase
MPLFAFADAARSYWWGVFPCGRRELRHWRLRAAEIHDPVLRCLAFEAQHTRRESLEGAIAFATFVPPASRAIVVRAITAYQIAFDYIDTISEQAGTDPITNGRRLNQALLRALDPTLAHLDYYAHHGGSDDAGYLCDLVDTCSTALQALPSYGVAAVALRRMTSRLIDYQSLNHGDGHGSYQAFVDWARSQTSSVDDLNWWEVGAAAGSPLPVFALFAVAAKPAVQAADVAGIEEAYFPWVASLSSLLDSLADRGEDAADGQRSLLDYYDSPAEVAERMRMLAAQAVSRTGALGESEQHRMTLAAMASFFHTTLRAGTAEDRAITQGILDTMDTDYTALTTFVLRALCCVRCLRICRRAAAVGGWGDGARRNATTGRDAARLPELRARRGASAGAARASAAPHSARAVDRRAGASKQCA